MFVPDEEAARHIEAWLAAADPRLARDRWPGWRPGAEVLGVALPGGAGLCVSRSLAARGEPVADRRGGQLPGVMHLGWAEAAAAGVPGAAGAAGGGAWEPDGVARGWPPAASDQAADPVGVARPWAAPRNAVALSAGGVPLCVALPGPPDAVAIAGALFATLFGEWRGSWGPRPDPEPMDAPEPVALAAVEGRLLAEALAAPRWSELQAAATRLALVRRERRAASEEEAIAAQRAREAGAGVAAYVGGACARRLGPEAEAAVAAALAHGLADLAHLPAGQRDALSGWALASLLERMEEAAPPLPAESARARAWAGRAIFPEGWKAAIAGGADLDAVLESHVHFDGGSRDDAALAQALADHGHARLLGAERAAAAERAKARRALVERIFAGPGTLVVFDVRELGRAGVRAPAAAQAVNSTLLVYPEGATFSYPGGTRLEVRGLAAAVDHRSGLIQARVQARLALRGDGAALREGQASVFDQGLELRLPGLAVRASSGVIQPIDGGYLIRLVR